MKRKERESENKRDGWNSKTKYKVQHGGKLDDCRQDTCSKIKKFEILVKADSAILLSISQN